MHLSIYKVKGSSDRYQVFMTIYVFQLCKMCERSDFPKYSHNIMHVATSHELYTDTNNL